MLLSIIFHCNLAWLWLGNCEFCASVSCRSKFISFILLSENLSTFTISENGLVPSAFGRKCNCCECHIRREEGLYLFKTLGGKPPESSETLWIWESAVKIKRHLSVMQRISSELFAMHVVLMPQIISYRIVSYRIVSCHVRFFYKARWDSNNADHNVIQKDMEWKD